MLILGLTGSIAMGKSATAQMFRDLGIPVFDADATVHDIYAGADARLIEQRFPGTLVDGEIDRTRLSAYVLGNASALRDLEDIVHPLVAAREAAFLHDADAAGHRVAVLDIPLLLENGAETRCDAVVVVSAPAHVQKQRAMARGGMSEEKFEAIRAKQMHDTEKRARAHFVIETDKGFDAARRAVGDIVRACAAMPGRVYANRRSPR